MGSIHVVKDEAQILPYCILHLTAHTEMGKRADAAWRRKATRAGAAVLFLFLALLIFVYVDFIYGIIHGIRKLSYGYDTFLTYGFFNSKGGH